MIEVMVDAPMKHCSGCDQDFPLTDEHFYRSGKIRIDGGIVWNALCKQCHNKSSAIAAKRRRALKEKTSVAKPILGTPEQCGSCSTTRGNILGDVDKISAHRYGYLCARCLQLVRDFQGDAERLRKVLEYVENTR